MSLPTQQLQLLKMFVQACKANPAILHSPELGFYREYLASMGAKLPPAPAWDPPKEEAPKEEKPAPKKEAPPAAEPAAASSESEAESDLELNLDFVTGPETEELPTLPSTDAEVSEENMDKANDKRSEAMRLMSDGDLEAAVTSLTEAIQLNPCMAVLYAKRAQMYVRMKRPNAAVQDCDRALELNNNSALAYKQRGRANRLLGKIDQAYKDLGKGQGIDYDDDTDELQKSLKDDVHKVQEHENKRVNKEKEREVKRRKKEAAKRRADAQKAYEEQQREQQAGGGFPGFPGGMPGGFPGGFPGAGGMPGGMGGMPGGMPGGMGGMPGGMPGGMGGAPGAAGGMPAGLGDLLNDPELLQAFQDPEVATAFMEISQNPAAAEKYKNNPRIMKVIEKLKTKFGGADTGDADEPGVDPQTAPAGAPSSAPSGPTDSSNDLD